LREKLAMPNRSTNRGLSRRSLLASLAGIPLSHAFVRDLFATTAASPLGLVMRESEPQNLESDFSALQSFLTPSDKFYVRNHFAVPQIDHKRWRLKVEGAVANPLQLTYDELVKLPAETKAVTLECAGNGRIYLVPKVEGVQWQNGAVGTAEWTGVPLNAILERAGVDPQASDVILEGADSGEPTKPSKPSKPIAYARSVPLQLARSGGILLAYKMNDEPLSPAHGFPVRAIVPGWYGMASVKWLSRIVASKQAFHGYYQTVEYAHWQHLDGFPTRVPVTQIQVKSQIARPALAEVIAKGSTYRVFGAAWSGNSTISMVEVSTDGGKHYAAAKLLGEPVEHAWRLWELSWNVPSSAGKHMLAARATDASGTTQPIERDRDRETYMINHIIPVEVQVR
jgi:DMSO/TMAO reductase YedYZ molybdopterin-dependent catalytic subunit